MLDLNVTIMVQRESTSSVSCGVFVLHFLSLDV